MGFVSGFVWGWDVGTVLNHVLNVGPVIVGTNWHRDMSNPDPAGYMRPTGMLYGGHAYLITGVNLKRLSPPGSMGAFRMQNSWRPGWSVQGGRAWISVAHMRSLLDASGEACTASEIRKA